MTKQCNTQKKHYVFVRNILLCLFFYQFTTYLLAVDIEISKFDSVSTNASLDVVVFIDPSPVAEKIRLNLRTTEGTGKAVFIPGGHVISNISQTSILQITGDQLSSVKSNIVLEVWTGEVLATSNVFTVVKEIKIIATEAKATVKKDGLITRSRAIQIAAETIKGKIKLQQGAPVAVELRGGSYIVTFGYIRPDPKENPGWRGPDFAARVTVDAFTGIVQAGIQRGS